MLSIFHLFRAWLELAGVLGLQLVKGVSSQGTLLHINVDGSPSNFQKVGNIQDYSGPGGQASVLDASNLESIFREKLPGLPDEGQFTFNMNVDPADAVHLALKNARRNRTLTEFRITLPNVAQTKLLFFGYVLGFQLSGGVDAIVKAALTIEIDGEVNWV
jgi:hypothetical protein